MRLLIQVHGCENEARSQYALVNLVPELARIALEWREIFQRAKTTHPTLSRLTFLQGAAEWLTLEPETPDGVPIPTEHDLEDVLRSLLGDESFQQLINSVPTRLPEEITMPPVFLQDTEYDTIDVSEDGLRLRCYPRHSEWQQETDLISWEWIEQATAESQANPPRR